MQNFKCTCSKELEIFGSDPDLDPLGSRVVIEITRAAYGEGDEPLEVVVNVRPAGGDVVVFDTYESADQPPTPPSKGGAHARRRVRLR